MNPEERAAFIAADQRHLQALKEANDIIAAAKPARRTRKPRQSRHVYLVIVESVNVPDYYAFRAEGVAERYAARVNREAMEADDPDTRAGVWPLLLRTAKEMPR